MASMAHPDSAPAQPAKSINLALQGGGSHGAFTWGVLDALLTDGRLSFGGISGTSAGALNAVALASGLAKAGLAGSDAARSARNGLAALWEEIGHWGALSQLHAQAGRALWGAWGPLQSSRWLSAMSGLVSPYEANPLDLSPLRDLLARHIDFEAIRRAGTPPVYVSATHVSTGKAVIFHGDQLDAQAVLASACLPTLFRAVEIDGQAYWDGGYAANPALTPLIDQDNDPDIVIVQINPLHRAGAPRRAPDILDRANELTFNASLLTQVRSIDLINRLLLEGALAPGSRKLVRLHRIDGGAEMLAYSASTKTRTDPGLIRDLFALGREAAAQWLHQHFDALGRVSTVDVKRDYLDDTRLSGTRATRARQRGPDIRSTPWLARLFRRRRPT